MVIYRRPTRCMVCQSELKPAFRGVEDRVYGVSGRWDLDRCMAPDCAALYLAHDLTAAQLGSFYETYSTHAPPVLDAPGIKGLYRSALRHIVHRRLGYPTAQGGKAALLARLLDAIPYFRQMALSRVFWLSCVPGGRVIEVGFGNGQSLALLREAGWDVAGSEIDAACVETARNLGFEVVHGEFTAGLFAAASADAVVASHAIEHVPDPRAFFAEARRVLRPGGRLVLRTPNAASTDARRAGPAWRGLEVPRHLTIHTPGSLAILAEQEGFAEISVRGTPLGGFIVQQSREQLRGDVPASSQSRKTVPFEMLETVRSIADNVRCAEIYLSCVKHDG